MPLSERDCARIPVPAPAERQKRQLPTGGALPCACGPRGYSLTVPAIRKLDWAAVEQIVAARAAGRSLRQVAAELGVSHSTVSRRIGRDPQLRARIRAAGKREARRTRDRERKARAKARREAGLELGSRPEQGQRSVASPSPGTRPHGRRDELRAARRILLDLTASFEAREVARETLLELLKATRSNGRPAYSLRLAAAKAIYDDPARFA